MRAMERPESLTQNERAVLSVKLARVWPDLSSDALGQAEAYGRAAAYVFGQVHPGSTWAECRDKDSWRRLAITLVGR